MKAEVNKVEWRLAAWTGPFSLLETVGSLGRKF